MDEILNSNDITGFDNTFLKFLIVKSKLYYKTVFNSIQEQEYTCCSIAFREIESFIIGKDQVLSEGSNVHDVCGVRLKAKEQGYICRDCATDVTCRLCRSCFIKSEHIKHNYQMFTNSGSGFCDCGDTEAWKAYPRCNIHGGNNDTSSKVCRESYSCAKDIQDDTAALSMDVKLRFLVVMQEIFTNVKQFVFRPLCKDNPTQRQVELDSERDFVKRECAPVDNDKYSLVLYNNEVHNFDQVINILKRCLLCTADQAMEFANTVDHDGRCVTLSTHQFKDVCNKQQSILSQSKTHTRVELLCRVHYSVVLGLQDFLLHTLRWLAEFVNRSPLLRLLLCQYLFYDVTTNDGRVFEVSSFIQDMFENYIETWKMVRSTTLNFVMSTIMKESHFRIMFAAQYVQNYKMIMDHYSRDDHDVQDSLICLSCQIFTVISVAKYLLEHNNVLTNIVQLIYSELASHSKPLVYDGTEYSDILIFYKDENELHRPFDPYERRLKSFGDLKFLLTSLLTAYTSHVGDGDCEEMSTAVQEWADRCVINFTGYVRYFVDILCLIQDSNTIERVIEHHIEHDPQWRTGIILMYDLVPCITLTSELIISNPICWDEAFNIIRLVLKKRVLHFESTKRTIFEYCAYKAFVLENNCPNKYVSIIKPLHRFMSALLLRTSLLQQLTELEIDCLFDHALQMVVFSSQQSGNMWIRNGSVPYILTQQMKCLTLSSEMFDRDIQLIQQLALCLRPEEFIVKCIHKFDLKQYFTSSATTLSEKKSVIQRVEDFLNLLIITLFFRHRPQVGKGMTKETCYEHLIFHILCVKPMTHSKVMKKLPQRLERFTKSKLTKLIENVSDQTTQSTIVMFSAKKSLIVSYFDRFSLYYSIQDRNEAEIYVHDVLTKELGIRALVPPCPIELSEDFERLYHYLSDECFIRVLDRILGYCAEKTNGEYWTDTMLDMVLHLIGSCLLDDINCLNTMQQVRRPLFLETAINPHRHFQIIEHLKILCTKVSSVQHLELIRWTVAKWNEVKKRVIFDPLECEETSNAMDVDFDDLAKETTNIGNVSKLRQQNLLTKMRNKQQRYLDEHSQYLHASSAQQDQERVHSTAAGVTCILCQECSDGSDNRPIVALAGAWRSTVLAKCPSTHQPLNVTESTYGTSSPLLESPRADMEVVPYDDDYMPEDMDRVVVRSVLPMIDHPEETFITTCGHLMHYDCKTRYVSVIIKQKQNVARTKGIMYPRIFNRCPLCKCICNIDIPIEITTSTSPMLCTPTTIMTFNEWVAFLAHFTPPLVLHGKKLDRSMHCWDKLGHKLSSIMNRTISFKRNDADASNSELLSCMAFRVGLAIKLQPQKFTKDAYNKFESISHSFTQSSLQDLIELDYAVAYTISVWEQMLSQRNSSLLTDVPERHLIGLHYLIRAVYKSHERLSKKEPIHRDCQSFLVLIQQLLFDCSKSQLNKVWQDLYNCKAPIFILEIDFTYVMTSLIFMRDSFNGGMEPLLLSEAEDEKLALFLEESTYHMNVVQLIFEFVSVQALLSLSSENISNVDESFSQLQNDCPDIWTEEIIDKLYQLRLGLWQSLPLLSRSILTRQEVVVSFTRAVLPYLRCAAFLLATIGSVQHSHTFCNWAIEFNHLVRVLDLSIVPGAANGLPLYIKAHLAAVANVWGDSIQTMWGTKLPHAMPQKPVRLIDLPHDFTDVLTLCLERGCSLRKPATGIVTEMTLCLICGDTFCYTGYCCRRPSDSSQNLVSGAQIHACQCHSGYSLYLNTKNSKVLVMFNQARWQIFLDPIYLDQYGESDIDLTKGNPLYLKHDAYEKLQRRWLDHSVGCIVNEDFLSNDFFV